MVAIGAEGQRSESSSSKSGAEGPGTASSGADGLGRVDSVPIIISVWEENVEESFVVRFI